MTQRIVGTITGDRITCLIDGRFRSLSMKSDQGQKLAEALKRNPQDIDEIRALADVAAYIARVSFGRVEVDDLDRLRLDGEVVDFGMTTHFLRVLREGFDIEPLVKFIENLDENPEADLKHDMFAFLQQGNLPFTEDGCFLAFKRVDDAYMDFHSSTVHYPIGGIVEMPRENCAKHRSACGTGLHVCYFDYLPNFHGGRGRILICKVNPRDVTDIPSGGQEHKLKCCRLEVVGEIPEEDAQAHFTKAVDKRYEPIEPEAGGDVKADPDDGDATAADGVTTVEPGDHVAPDQTSWFDIGFSDGAEWAIGDTHYDCHPNSGKFAEAAKYAQASIPRGQFEDYAKGFKAGYDHIFGRT